MRRPDIAVATFLCALPLLRAQNGAPANPPPAAVDRPVAPNLNLLGRSDTSSGEGRRNENVQFNLVDNNALKDLNVRLGTTATLIDEFRADRSYFGSEFGNRPASPIHLSPARSSAFHGSLFAAHVSSVLNARSFFTAGDLPPAHENHYGFSVTRRLWRGAALSADGSQQPIRGNVNGNILVPRANERTPLTADPVRRALIQRFLNAFPTQLPNRTDINERALNTNSPQSIDDHHASARLDQDLAAQGSFALRYAFTSQIVDAFQLVAGQNPDTTTRNHSAQATYARSFSPELLATVTAAFDRVTSRLVAEPNAVGPQVNFSNVFTTLGPSSTIPINRVQNRFRYGLALLHQRSALTWYAGADYLRAQVNGSEVSSHRGNLYFRNDFGRDAIANFLLGVPSRFSGAIGNVHRGFRQSEAAFYWGGTARLRPGLDISFGVRYSLTGAPYEVDGLTRVPYGCDCNNVAPRFGFAWRLPGARAGVLRAAYGLHYGEIFTATYNQLRFNPPEVVKFELLAPDLLAPFSQLNIAVDPSARAAVFALPSNLRAPYAHQYNLVWEPQLSSRVRLQLGYAGSRANGLFLLWYTNRARIVDGIPQTTATINSRRPDQNFYDVRRIINGSRGYFDAARVTLILPLTRGVSLDASYWISKAIDLGGAYSNTGSSDDARQSLSQTEQDVWGDLKGPSSFDQRHAFLVRGSWTTPRLTNPRRLAQWFGQWDFSGVALFKTGTPFTVITGSDGPGYGNVDGDNGDRPRLLNPAILGATVNHPDTSVSALPAAAFAFLRTSDSRGNLGNNTFRKDGVANVNFSVSRTFAFASERRLLFRAESVNLLNSPQFAEPWRELTSPSFGFITNTLNEGRTLRLMLRLSF